MRGKPSANRTDLGNKIKELCAKKGLTQAALANRIGVGSSTFSRWVCGADPRLSTLVRIADALGVSLDELASRNSARKKKGEGKAKDERAILQNM